MTFKSGNKTAVTLTTKN